MKFTALSLLFFFLLSLFNISKAQNQANSAVNGKINQVNWSHCTLKYDADVHLPDNDLAGTVSFRMKRDSIVWFSVSAIMGIQILKGIINKDSAHLLDLYNKKYYALSLEDLNSMQSLPANLSAIQALIVGNPLITDGFMNLDSTKMNQFTCMQPPYLGYGLDIDNNKLVSNQHIVEKGIKEVKISYKTRSEDLPIAIPHDVTWKIEDLRSGLKSIRMDLTLKTARFDVIPSYPFNVPNGYEKVDVPKN